MSELEALCIVYDLAIENGLEERLETNPRLRPEYDRQQEAFELVSQLIENLRME